ncbi:MAG: SDR family oxidoreductase [Nocardioidaceae bacterium]|nr:SDR family oxidoreductase [Nocardioidaceae bacterium]
MPLALITGPTSGIGFAFARALAAEGHDLVLVSRDSERLQRLAADLHDESGVRCEVLPADLGEVEQCARVETRLAQEPFDVVVNNAGFGLRRPFEANDVEVEQRGFDVMVRAVMRLCHAAIGPMRQAGRGDVVNVSSVAGFLPRGTYGAHKAWVTSFSRWAALHYRPDGLRVMALCPGFVRTEFHQRMDADLAGIPSWMWLDADRLVAEALTDLRNGKAVSVPTRRYKAVVAMSRIAPASLVEKAARRGR